MIKNSEGGLVGNGVGRQGRSVLGLGIYFFKVFFFLGGSPKKGHRPYYGR